MKSVYTWMILFANKNAAELTPQRQRAVKKYPFIEFYNLRTITFCVVEIVCSS